MPITRRRFLEYCAAGMVAASLGGGCAGPRRAARDDAGLLKPPRLRPGDTVALVSPAGALHDSEDLATACAAVGALGLEPRTAPHALDRHGYFGGTDAARAEDLHQMFADSDVRALLALRGGWGAARLLALLDYDLVRRNPKIVVGYSDVTSLLLALYARAGLVTFHGPVGISTWNDFTTDHFRRVLFEAEQVHMMNPENEDSGPVPARTAEAASHVFRTITPGVAQGRLVGGNLTVLTALLGSTYVPDWRGHVLFVEDIGEAVYRIDRMLTQLQLAGVLSQIEGFVFGRCTGCGPQRRDGFTLNEVLADHLAPLGIPAWYGSMIGHIRDKFTVPLGIRAEIDATRGTLKLLEPAVS